MNLTEFQDDETAIVIEMTEDLMHDFHFKGGVEFTVHPSQYNCMNCFNARISQAKVSVFAESDENLTFNFTHLGVQMQTKVENGYRSFPTTRSSPKTVQVLNNQTTTVFSDKSPFANFFIELSAEHYDKCKQLADSLKKECEYKERMQIMKLQVEFTVSYMGEYPDQHNECFPSL